MNSLARREDSTSICRAEALASDVCQLLQTEVPELPLPTSRWAFRRVSALPTFTPCAQLDQDSFTSWKRADPDIPILIAAKAEFAKLK
jgi:hypothetical protein